eukprot:1160717-Pelagomonas_calceolata.AAC.10
METGKLDVLEGDQVPGWSLSACPHDSKLDMKKEGTKKDLEGETKEHRRRADKGLKVDTSKEGMWWISRGCRANTPARVMMQALHRGL